MRLAWIVTAMMLLPAVAWAQETPKAPPPRPRPNPDQQTTPRSATPTSGQVYVGERAPDFELETSTPGRNAKLSSFRGKWTLLTFCDRRPDIVALRPIEPDLTSIDVQIVNVSHERAQTLKTLVARDTLRYAALLSDGTGQISSMYGLYDAARSEIMPGFIVLDPNGVVRVTLLGKMFPAEDVARLVHFIVGRP